MGQFVITVRTNGDFQFILKSSNGRTILCSLGFSTISECQNCIDSVRRNSLDDSKYDLQTNANGKFYFNLRATNGQTLGMSGMFESESTRDEVIVSVKRYAPNATVID